MPAADPRFAALPTPCLLLDEVRMTRNIARMEAQAARLGLRLRPHLKTAKSVEIARRLVPPGGGATVSTLAEAEVFAAAGFSDLLYAVGIAPGKLDRVLAIRRGGCDLKVILDSMEQAVAVAAASRRAGQAIPALIEIDSDGHRGGLRPDDPAPVAIGRYLAENGATPGGVMTHAGDSYGVRGAAAHAAFAEQERAAVAGAAARLRAAGVDCPVVSMGSTPTALALRDPTGVTELRAGVHVFFDLVMAGIEVCAIDDIAISVLTSVIGSQPERGRILIDAGWMALSRDRGTAGPAHAVDQGYGLVCDAQGRPIDGLIVTATTQEHGIVALRPGASARLPELPVGTLLRILPNHACATAAQHAAYHLIPAAPGADGAPLPLLPRFGGW